MIVFDTDVLSAFAKADAIKELFTLFNIRVQVEKLRPIPISLGNLPDSHAGLWKPGFEAEL